MGMGGSKNAAEETTLAGQRRPLFRLRRRRRIIKTLSTISTQELLVVTDTGSLKDYASSPSHSLIDPLDRSLSMPTVSPPMEAAQACSAGEIKDETRTPETKEMEGRESAVRRNDSEGDRDQIVGKGGPIRESCGDGKEMLSPDHRHDKEAREKEEEAQKEEEEEEEEEQEEGGWVLGLGDLPGSPSFREYCRFSIPDPDDSSEDGKYSLDDAEPSVTNGSINSAASDATSPAKPSNRSVKERFRRLRILARGPIAISNLLSMSMSSCYNHTPRTSGEVRLLSIKSGS
ncbi:uncharacterized protein LOC116258009 [Nymphaea colorata]|nr:uncharacterized protein LOC116258009 [Nymphaea colorata]